MVPRQRQREGKGKRGEEVLFIDARHLFLQATRAHRVFGPEQIEFLANIIRLWRGEEIETEAGSEKGIKETFPKGHYRDVPGLCRVANRMQIEAEGWSLNPGRYVGVAPDRSKMTASSGNGWGPCRRN